MLREKVSATDSLKNIEVFFLVHDELMKAERQWATANNIPYADVIGSMDSNRQYLVSWVHLNPAGNRVVASVLTDEILKYIRLFQVCSG